MTDEGGGGEPLDFTKFFTTNPPLPGAVDILAVGRGAPSWRLAELASLFRHMVGQDGRSFVGEIVIVLHPGDRIADEERLAALRDAFAESVEAGLGRKPDPAKLDAAFAGIAVRRVADLQADALVRLASEMKPRTAMIVAQAAAYRDPGASRPDKELLIPEDIWSVHLARVARTMLQVAKDRGIYVLLDAGESAPELEDNQQRLLAVQGVGVLTGSARGDVSEADLAQDSVRWATLAEAGRLGAALDELERRLPNDRRRKLIALQLYNVAGVHHLVRAELQTNPELLKDWPADAAIQVAKIAEQADLDAEAAVLIRDALPRLGSMELLVTALEVAQAGPDAALVAETEDALRRLFPDAPVLKRRRIRAFLEAGLFSDAVEAADGDPRFEEGAAYWGFMAEQLAAASWAPETILAEADRRFPKFREAARIDVALALERQGSRAAGLRTLAAPAADQERVTRSTARALLAMLQRGLLVDDPEVRDEVAGDAIEATVAYLAGAAEDGATRLQLVRLLRPQALGGRSAALMTMSLQYAFSRPVKITPAPKYGEGPKPASDAEVVALAGRAAEWLKAEGAMVLGSQPIPVEVLQMDADEALAGLNAIVEEMARRAASADDRATLTLLLAIGAAVAPHATTPGQDLVLIRIAATQLAIAGQLQWARDLAEQMLQLARNDPQRLRIAWFGFADIYARARNDLEALLGLVCALNADEAATWEQIWHETTLGFRILRDLGLSSLAGRLLKPAAAALEGMGAAQDYADRLEWMALQVELAALGGNSKITEAEFGALTGRAMALADSASGKLGEAAATASLLAATLREGARRGFAPPAGAGQQLSATVAKAPASLQPLLRAIGALAPRPEDVLAFARQIEGARHVEDLGFDLRNLAIVAERLLDSDRAEDPAVAAFAAELLADQAIAQPGVPAGPAVSKPLPTEIGGPLAAMEAVSSPELAVVVLALGEDELVRLAAQDGKAGAPVREAQETFSMEALRRWRAEGFPYAYANPKELNIFFDSTVGLGVSELPPRAVIVPSTALQGYPVSLLRLGDGLAGRTHRLAMAPSLTWLQAARAAALPRAARRIAWIPDASPLGEGAELQMIAEDLRPSFEEHGVEVSHGAAPPLAAKGAELVIVAAHGQVVADEKRFFRSVRDDDEAVAMTAAALSGSLDGAGVAVLFVCSGGRIDEHPGASTTVGLAKQLLDRGCSAVIAPPWPLDVGVPARWLPTFLAAWDAGRPVIDACFEANQEALARLGDHPSKWLAMTVYGDPLAGKTG